MTSIIKSLITTPMASSVYGSQTASLAFDGNSSTYWRGASSAGPEWIGAQLPVASCVRKVRVELHSSYRPKDFTIEGSSDAINWNVVYTGQFTNATGWREYDFAENDDIYLYWRINCSTCWSTYFGVREIEFYVESPQGDYSYSSGIQITFDKAILSTINETVVAQSTGIKQLVQTPMASSYNTTDGRIPANAFDGNTGTFWRGTSTANNDWIGALLYFAAPINEVRFYIGNVYRPKTYSIEYSDDGISWSSVATGDFSNATGWQIVDFTNFSSHHYWRANFSAGYGTTVAVYEMELYSSDILYHPNGFTVTGNQFETSPEGESIANQFDIKRVTKAENNMSVFVWLYLPDRMKYPDGQITVDYDKSTGNLEGADSAQVDSFSLSFTPTNIVPFFNPSSAEHIDANLSQDVNLIEVLYSAYQDEAERIEATISQSNEVIHVDDIID